MTVVPATLLSGTNTVTMTANNTTYWNLTFALNASNAITAVSNLNNCYAWRNVTVHGPNVTNVVLTYSKISGSGVYNSSAYLNGTLQTSNRTNNSTFNYSTYNDSSTIYVNISTLNNSSTWNVLVDQLCLNATAIDEATGSSISSFTVNETTCAAGNRKSTTVGYIWFNGTELCSGGTAASIFRASASGYTERDSTINLLNQAVNRTFSLLAAASGAFINFHVRSDTGAALPNVQVSVVVTLTGILVGTGTTDSAGTVRFFLSPSTQYTLTFSLSGYETQIFNIIPTNTEYTIVMQRVGGNITTGAGNATAKIIPGIYNNSSQTQFVNWSVFSPNPGSVIRCALTVWVNQNGTSWTRTITTGCTATGGNLSVAMNLSNATRGDNVSWLASVDYLNDQGVFLQIVSNQTVQIQILYFGAGNVSRFSIPGIMRGFTVSGVGGAVLALTAVLFSSLITLAMNRLVADRGGLTIFGGGFIMTGLLAVFSAGGMFPVGVVVLMGILVIAVYFFRRV